MIKNFEQYFGTMAPTHVRPPFGPHILHTPFLRKWSEDSVAINVRVLKLHKVTSVNCHTMYKTPHSRNTFVIFHLLLFLSFAFVVSDFQSLFCAFLNNPGQHFYRTWWPWIYFYNMYTYLLHIPLYSSHKTQQWQFKLMLYLLIFIKRNLIYSLRKYNRLFTVTKIMNKSPWCKRWIKEWRILFE